MKTKTTAKAKQTRRKAENRNPRTCYAMSKDKATLYRFVNHAQRLDHLLRDKLLPIDALAFRAMTNADVTGKLIVHDMRGVALNPDPIPVPEAVPTVDTSKEVQQLLSTFKSGVAAILSEFSQKLDRFQPATTGGSIERLSPSH